MGIRRKTLATKPSRPTRASADKTNRHETMTMLISSLNKGWWWWWWWWFWRHHSDTDCIL